LSLCVRMHSQSGRLMIQGEF